MDDNNLIRTQEYANKITENNCVEALRIACNTYHHHTKCHLDIQNDKKGNFGTILSISKIEQDLVMLLFIIVKSASVKVMKEVSWLNHI